MVQFTRLLGAAADRAADLWPLAVVPLVSSFLAVDNLRRVVFAEGIHFGVTFRFPATVADLWTFVSVPGGPSGVHVSPTAFLLPVVVALQAALAAGYLGSIRDALATGEYDFVAGVRRYFAPLVAFLGAVAVLGLVAVLVAAGAPLMALVLFPVFPVLSYLFYGTPYLVVVADLPVVDALERSYDLAVDGGEYLEYGLKYLGAVALGSLVGTAFVANLGAAGVVLGAFLAAPAALVLTVATVAFFADRYGEYGVGGRADDRPDPLADWAADDGRGRRDGAVDAAESRDETGDGTRSQEGADDDVGSRDGTDADSEPGEDDTEAGKDTADDSEPGEDTEDDSESGVDTADGTESEEDARSRDAGQDEPEDGEAADTGSGDEDGPDPLDHA